jgi:hypothetical protein
MAKGATKVSGADGASDKFVEELAETCAELGEVMTSLDLRKTSSRMPRVIWGEWHKKIPFLWLPARIILCLVRLEILKFFLTDETLSML